jgi:hypothetical protein
MTTKKDTKKPVARKDSAAPRMIDSRNLAALIVAAWTHPDCPRDIRDAINEGTSNLFNTLNEDEPRVYMTEPYIRSLITAHMAKKGGAK